MIRLPKKGNVMYRDTTDNRYANRTLLLIMLICILPLLIIFYVSHGTSENIFVHWVADATNSIPVVTSSFNPLMTKVMAIYVKTAPVAAILSFLLLLNKRKTLAIKKKHELIQACILSPFIYAFFIYYFFMYNMDLTTAGRTVRWLSKNDFTLLAFYICLYYAFFLLTYVMCYYPILVHRLWKER